MFDKLTAIEQQYEELMQLPRHRRGAERSVRVPEAREDAGRDRADRRAVPRIQGGRAQDVAETEELAAGGDADMRELAHEELKSLVVAPRRRCSPS